MNRTISSSRPHDLSFELFLSTREEKACSPLTLRNYRTAISLFLQHPAIPENLAELCPDHVLLWSGDMRKKGSSPANRAWHQRHVFAFLRWLYQRGDIERDPLRGISLVQVPQVPQHQMSPSDMAKIETSLRDVKRVSDVKARDLAIVLMLWATGLRRSELVSLDLADVDLTQMTAVVMGKGQKQRRVPFDGATKRALLEYLIRERGREDGPLFLSRSKQRLTGDALRLMLARLSRDTKVPVGAHAFRRGFARRMRGLGLDLGETAALMGHSTLVMTRQYSQVGEHEAALDAYRKLVG